MSSHGLMMMRDQPKRISTNIRYVDDERPVYKCPYCNKDFTDYSSWWLHKQLHTSTEVFRCELCPYTCRIKKYLTRHMKFHRPPTEYTCEVCGKGFHFRGKRDTHMRVHTKEKPFVCTVCGKAFRSSYTLSGHMYTHTDEKPFQCSYCEYACRDSSTLRKHEERHIGVSKSFECKICDKSYKCKWQLKAHLEEKHFGLEAKRFPCPLCDKLFKSKYYVDRHVKSVHEKSSSCECNVCGNHISNKGNLIKHLRRHVNVKPYKCTFSRCGRMFKDKGDLRKHVIIHFPEKQHPCGICGRLFARRRRLERHVAAHAARTKAVECHHCGVLFYSKNYLLLHISRKHDRKMKKFICDLCDFSTPNKPSLVMHLKYRHGTRRDKKCQICDKVYKRHEYLEIHYLKSHNVRFKTLLQETEVQSADVKEELDEEEEVEEEEEYHPEIDLLEIHKEELIEPEYSDPITYSETVLSEDITRSIMQRDIRMPGEPEGEFDSFFIDHVMENPDNSVEKLDDYCVDALAEDTGQYSMEIDVEQLDHFDMERLQANSRENSVEIDVEKLDKFDMDDSEISGFEEPDNRIKELDKYEDSPGRHSTETSLQNFDTNSVKSVKIVVEKLDKNIVEKATSGKNVADKCVEKSVKVTVEKLDINNLKNNTVNNSSIRNSRKYKSILEKNNSLQVCVEKLDVSRLKKLRKINMVKMNKNTAKKIRVTRPDRSCAVNINKRNIGRRDITKRRRKRDDKQLRILKNKTNQNSDSTFDPDITDYSKGVLSEDISRCLQERAGGAPGEPENTLESIFIDHFMEKNYNNCQTSDDESDILVYSKKVLSEDVSRSIMRRDRRVPGDPEDEIDRLFIDHVIEKPDRTSVELVKKNINTQKERYVKKCVDKMLQRITAQKEAAILEEARRKYNKRIEILAREANKKEHVNVKYFQSKSSEGENDVTDTKDDEIGDDDDDGDEDDEQTPIGDQDIEKRNNKINFNTHQCYVCFELFKTKSDLTHHCKEHFQICNYRMLKKCPYCGYVANLNMKRHLRLKHNIRLNVTSNGVAEIHNENGPKYVLETEKCSIDVIPSVDYLNNAAAKRIDEANRHLKNNQITSNRLVKHGTEWIIDKDILKVSLDYQLPEFSDEEYLSLNISGDKYEDAMKKLSFLAKQRGLRMLFPCDVCEKVCRRLSGLVLHNRKHEINPKPCKRKMWKYGVVNTKNIHNNRVKVISKVRNSEAYEEFARSNGRTSRNVAKKYTDNDENSRNCDNVASEFGDRDNGRNDIATDTVENGDSVASKLSDNVASDRDNGRNDIATETVENGDSVASKLSNDATIDNNIRVKIKKMSDNRFAKPQSIVSKHKCDQELMEFYTNNVKGDDVEFCQFLKIFNKMSRENVNDFDDLEARSDFGIHYKDTGNTDGQTDDNTTEDTSNTETLHDNCEEDSNTSSKILEIDNNNTGLMKINKNSYKRVIMISKRDRERREEIKNELRKKVDGNDVVE